MKKDEREAILYCADGELHDWAYNRETEYVCQRCGVSVTKDKLKEATET